jgi:hypothetical protein
MYLFALLEIKKGLYPYLPYHTSNKIKTFFLQHGANVQRTQRGTLKPPILVGDLQENAFNVIFEVGATDELSNRDHKVEKILPTSPSGILLEAPLPPQIVNKGVKRFK